MIIYRRSFLANCLHCSHMNFHQFLPQLLDTLICSNSVDFMCGEHAWLLNLLCTPPFTFSSILHLPISSPQCPYVFQNYILLPISYRNKFKKVYPSFSSTFELQRMDVRTGHLFIAFLVISPMRSFLT